jgi:hypothetical protein
VCVVGKNYRLQDIQLSKIRLRPRASARQVRAGRYRKTWRDRSMLRTLSEKPGLPNRSREAAEAGGEYRARTGDLLVANQALSQLS